MFKEEQGLLSLEGQSLKGWGEIGAGEVRKEG